MKLLLDEHLFPRLADMVRSLAPGLDIVSIHQWRDGQFTNQPDERILREDFLRELHAGGIF